jgi:hypothetical protein
MRAILSVLLPATLLTPACGSEPARVHVPDGPTAVRLVIAASATETTVGQPVVLHAERFDAGRWKEVDRAALPDGRCWLVRPPPAHEAEVADNVRWQVTPPGAARFNTAIRPDHTREVTFTRPGRYVVEATTAVWCGPATGAPPLAIEVRP